MKILHVESTASTNLLAKQLLSNSSEVIVTADYQTQGKGRNGKHWFAKDKSSILISFGFTSESLLCKKSPLFYQACTALSVQAFLLEYLSIKSIAIKYPNDVLCLHNEEFKKISGSLIETEYLGGELVSIIIGIGINILPCDYELDSLIQPISLFDLVPDLVNLEALRKSFMSIFLTLIQTNESLIMEQWKSSLTIIGKTIHIKDTPNPVTVISINSFGMLVCSDGNKEYTVHNPDTVRYSL